MTAAWSAKEGLDCHLVLEERVKGSYKPEASGNNFLFELLNVKSIGVVPGGSDMMAEMEEKADALSAAGKLFAKTEAVLLDPVYSGKAAAGLIDLVHKGRFPAGSNVLFLHTGVSPALYAYLYTFRKG